jgi:hypothetical protein
MTDDRCATGEEGSVTHQHKSQWEPPVIKVMGDLVLTHGGKGNVRTGEIGLTENPS